MDSKVAVVWVPYITNRIGLDQFTRAFDIVNKSVKDSIVIANRLDELFRPPVISRSPVVAYNSENCLSRAWNIGISTAIQLIDADYVLLPNSDVVPNKDCVNNLIKFARENPQALLWTATEHFDLDTIDKAVIGDEILESPNFSFFLIHRDLVDVAGKFDEMFRPAYFEDNDMHYRITLTGFKALATGSAKFFHYGSQTLRQDPGLERAMPPMFDANRQYYIQKWGGEPGKEKHKTPFGR